VLFPIADDPVADATMTDEFEFAFAFAFAFALFAPALSFASQMALACILIK
jgi:hypothetical protein